MDNQNPQNNPQNNQPNQNPLSGQKKPIQNNPSVRAVRTLEEDIRDAMQNKNLSAVKIAVSNSQASDGSKTISNDPIQNRQSTSPSRQNIPPQIPITPAEQPMPIGLSGSPFVSESNQIYRQNSKAETPSKKEGLPIKNEVVTPSKPFTIKEKAPEYKSIPVPPKVNIPNIIKDNIERTERFDNYGRMGTSTPIKNEPIPPKTSMSQKPLATEELKQETYQDPTIIESEKPPFPWKKILITIISLALIAGGGYGAYYIYSILPDKTDPDPQTLTEEIISIIPADTNTKYIINSNKNPTEKILSILNSPSEANKITNILFRKDNTFKSGGSDITTKEFFKLLDINVSEQLISSLKTDFMFGYYSDGMKNYPFILLKANFFQGALAYMMRFEKDMCLEMTPLFIDQNKITFTSTSTLITATSTENSTSTPSASSTIITTTTTEGYYGGKTFIDALINNRDVRILKKGDAQNTTILLYSFIDQENIVITTNENAFKAILSSFERRKFVR